MTKEQLLQIINDNFRSQADFVRKFNDETGVKLTTSYLNRQLQGEFPLTQGFEAAYKLFFRFCLIVKAESKCLLS
jgi:hypothetical protein